MLENGLTLLWMLVAVVVVLGLAYLATRWISTRGIGGIMGAGSAGEFSVLHQIVVGRNERLLLVRLGERCLLLGVTAGGISLLKELEPEEAEYWLRSKTQPNGAPSFLDVIRENFKKKK